ncbi:hypothetical protein R6Q59_025004 [Mikania micrantha]
MIVEDEGHMITNWSFEEHEPKSTSYSEGTPAEFAHYLQRFKSLRSKDTHIALRNDLMEPLWDLWQAYQEYICLGKLNFSLVWYNFKKMLFFYVMPI